MRRVLQVEQITQLPSRCISTSYFLQELLSLVMILRPRPFSQCLTASGISCSDSGEDRKRSGGASVLRILVLLASGQLGNFQKFPGVTAPAPRIPGRAYLAPALTACQASAPRIFITSGPARVIASTSS